MMKIRCSKDAEEKKNWIKTLIKKCILLGNVTYMYHNARYKKHKNQYLFIYVYIYL